MARPLGAARRQPTSPGRPRRRRAGAPVQLEVVAAIARVCCPEIPVELGGGMRAVEHVEAAFAGGVERVVLGTAAVGLGDDDPATRFRKTCLDRFG